MTLANTVGHKYDNIDVGFKDEPVQFGTYICATYHICSNLELFIDTPRVIGNVIVKGNSGSTVVAGIGAVDLPSEMQMTILRQ